MHAVIASVLNDLKSQNLENVSSLVYNELLKERQLVAERLNKTKAELNGVEHQLQMAEDQSKRLALLVKDLETIDDNTKLIQILTLQKQHLSSRIKELQTETNYLYKTAQYLELIQGNQDEITRNIKSISIMTCHDNDNDIRKMITYLVVQATFTPKTIDSKNVVTLGEIAI